jgi:signal transduction histidine kinase
MEDETDQAEDICKFEEILAKNSSLHFNSNSLPVHLNTIHRRELNPIETHNQAESFADKLRQEKQQNSLLNDLNFEFQVFLQAPNKQKFTAFVYRLNFNTPELYLILVNNFKDSLIAKFKNQLKQKDKILANVTHDLRTPLNAVNYMLDKIEDLVLDKPAPSKIERKNIL